MSAAAALWTPTQKRAEAARIMDLLVEEARKVHYFQWRLMVTRGISTEAALRVALARVNGIRTDCSETLTLIAHVSGWKDPNLNNFSGEGNSDEMFARLPHFDDPAAAFIGSIASFGWKGRDHVAMVRRRGKDPLMFSHGGENGPLYMPLSWLDRAIGQRQMLSVNGLL